MSARRRPEMLASGMGRPVPPIGHGSHLKGWTPRRTGRLTKREAFLFRHVDAMYADPELPPPPIAIVGCPTCQKTFLLFDPGIRTPRAYMRSKIMDHAKRDHSTLGVREQSLLADRAVEAMR